MSEEAPVPPRTIADLPPEVQRFLRARMEASEEHTRGCERRVRWRRVRGVALGAFIALATSPLLGGSGWTFPLVFTLVGVAAALLVVRLECEALGGTLIYGGGTMLFTLVAHFIGLTNLDASESVASIVKASFLIGWAMLLGIGALIGFLAEQDRGLNTG